MSQPKTNIDSPSVAGEAVLPVSQDLLQEMGWSAFVALADIRVELMSPVLNELRQESCVHSWHTVLSEWESEDEASLVAILLEATQKQRPTAVFTYAGRRIDGSLEVVGVAAVSECIRHGFEENGFPVIARAFIRPGHRGRGLYPSMVQHRLTFCEERWGDDLKAVHLGSADPAVWGTVSAGKNLSLPFLYIGDEDLEVVGSHHEVRDFLAFSPRYLSQVRQSLSDLASGEHNAAFLSNIACCQTFLAEGAHGVRYPIMRVALMELLSGTSGLSEKARADLQALVYFCDAIPVVR